MGRTKTSGISTDAEGNKTVDKCFAGERVYARLGQVSHDEAVQWLASRIERIRLEKQDGTRRRVTFREAAAKYLTDFQDRIATIDVAAWHIETLDAWIGDRYLEEIHDETLRPFKEHRLGVDRVSLMTVNRAVEIVRRILNLAARFWRRPNGMTWMQTAPLVTIERNRQARRAYPLSWEEQDLLFGHLPQLNRDMALFKVNTGMREQEVCSLEWSWEVKVDALKTSVFIIPGAIVKNREDRLVVLNCVARSVVEKMRGHHPRFVFAYRRERTRDPAAYAKPQSPPRRLRHHEQHGMAERPQAGCTGVFEGTGARGPVGLRPRAHS